MAKAPIMPVFTDALVGDTTHLSAEQFGAYVLILIATWRNNGQALPDDDEQLAHVCRSGLVRWRKKLRPVLAKFFAVNESGWHQQRLEIEWERVSKLISKRQANGGAGGRAKRQQTLPFERSKPVSKPVAIHNQREASLPNQDPESTSNTESLNAAREGRKKGEAEEKQTGNPQEARCARLARSAERSTVHPPNKPAIKRTPVGMARPALWECNDEQPSLASATDYRDLGGQDQGQDSLAERVASSGAALPRARGQLPPCRKSPALKAKIREQLRAKHARYLQACGPPDELAAYWAAMLDDDSDVGKRVFEEVDRRMRCVGWDDMRPWKHQHGIGA